MKIKANGKTIPGVESVYADQLYLDDTTRSALHLRLKEALSAGDWEALLGGEITVEEGGETAVHAGYDAIHDCRVTLLRTDDAERTVAELNGRLSAAQSGQEEAEAALETVRETQGVLLRALAPKMTDTEVLAFDPVWPDWQPDTRYAAAEVLRYAGALYRVLQEHTSQAHQEPGGEGMLAVYRPVQQESAGGEVLPWVSGEEIVLGDLRAYEGVVYECIAPGGAGANVHTPDVVPAVWREVQG